ncbi:hypothetical protein RRG08_031941 [Elysia crispata]|uniref:Uncharacterized protein n=1 Tax=Elysia crispata TaxID=231223 RepID=A0AAE1DYS3_9GAST|nr:hypothetical protein RRG08_031941 [Elysia crispata]
MARRRRDGSKLSAAAIHSRPASSQCRPLPQIPLPPPGTTTEDYRLRRPSCQGLALRELASQQELKQEQSTKEQPTGAINKSSQQEQSTGAVNKSSQQELSTTAVNRSCQQEQSTGAVNNSSQQELKQEQSTGAETRAVNKGTANRSYQQE